ncbi:hypothetical protein O3G_MSEX010646 [Manduca sexta]|uniref:Uncharacterized protein n=1 Tax=Manduca sexta TaxID=7130 RepID=A0A921ZJZ2_MANSE|nr:hypothetical protein O3G_MSEX010646 [Manduca sexta]
MYKRFVFCLVLLMIIENESRGIKIRVKRQTIEEAPPFTFSLSGVMEDASRIFGKVVEKLFANKKMLGVEPRIIS